MLGAMGEGKEASGADGSTNSPRHPTDIELMKEKFAKLLLGEDMSGGGKGVSSAMALSNAITNLAASVFGEQKRLEPMAPETKLRWRKEIDWLLSVTDHIVEFVPSKQRAKDGSNMEIMTTKQRSDIQMNIPALRKLDAMLLDCLDNFKDQKEFYYGKKKDIDDGHTVRQEEKWWIPTPRVPPNGLSDATRKWLVHQKDSVTQVLKAAMAINSHVLSEMEIPEGYMESLPKNGRESLGDLLYKIITDEYFDPDYFLANADLSSEHKTVDLKNRLEASVIIWRRKLSAKDAKSSWVGFEKREMIEDRGETILLMLKHRFPGLPQSDLDISKIQFNRDVGQAILESYSRTIESLAHTVLSRIEDVVHADNQARNPPKTEKLSSFKSTSSSIRSSGKHSYTADDNQSQTPSSKTLLDFMGWDLDGRESERNSLIEAEPVLLSKPHFMDIEKKLSYTERLETLGAIRSPTARH